MSAASSLRSVALATAALVILATTATADNLWVKAPEINVTGVNEVIQLAQGGSFAASLWIEATQGTCDAADGSAATVTLESGPAGVTMDPASLTFTACGAANAQSASIKATGSAPLTSDPTFVKFSIADADGGYNTNQNQGKFKIQVVAPAATVPTPTITRTIVGSEGANGWYTGDVSFSFTLDPASHSGWDLTQCQPAPVTADTTGVWTGGCIVKTTDGAFLASVEPIYVKRDATVPTVLIHGVTDGASYPWGFVPSASCSASDATSGLPAGYACVPTLSGSTLGAQTIGASATDVAGNEGTATVAFTVTGWETGGFYAPVRMGQVTTVKAGSTVPLKFNIFAGQAPELHTSTDHIAMAAQKVSGSFCSGSSTLDPATLVATETGATQLRWDETGQQYIFNWKTPVKPGECWVASMAYAPPGAGGNVASIVALFQLK